MSINIIHRYALICDKCRADLHDPFQNEPDALQFAEDLGWEYNPATGEHSCPNCIRHFHCADWNRCGSHCEVQCEACSKHER